MRFFSNLSVFLSLVAQLCMYYQNPMNIFFSRIHTSTPLWPANLHKSLRSTPTTLLCNVCQHGISDPCEAFESSVHMVKNFLLFSIGSKPIEQKLKREKLDIIKSISAKIDCLSVTKYEIRITNFSENFFKSCNLIRKTAIMAGHLSLLKIDKYLYVLNNSFFYSFWTWNTPRYQQQKNHILNLKS